MGGERVSAPSALATRGVSKSYGGHVVLSDVDFGLAEGEIVAVVGENGAGKSTFAKILVGVIQADAGSLALAGRRVVFRSPRDALRHGISYIPQELAYLPNMTVADNLLVGRWPSRYGMTTGREIERRATEEAERFGIELDVRARIADLKLADRQLVEIVKSLTRNARVIVLDEPTASLTKAEADQLFDVLRGLAADGVSVVFISHRIDEIFAFTQRIVVLRNGRVVANLETASTNARGLIGHMLGSVVDEYRALEAAESADTGRKALEVRDLSRAGQPPIDRVSFSVDAGEILGLFGSRGAGGEVIAEGLGGRHGDFAGEVRVGDRAHEVFSTPRAARRAGIGYVPAERKRDGLVMPLSVQANLSLLVLRSLSRLGWVRRRSERALAAELIDRLRIRSRGRGQTVETLSGGNQQKTMLGSRLATSPTALVLHEPTRGVDVGARVEIQKYIRGVAEAGAAVLWVTTDVEEAVLVTDRLLVLRDGEIVGELRGDAKTQANALDLATRQGA